MVRNGEWLLVVTGVPWGRKTVLKLTVVTAAQLCEYIENY